MKAVIEFMSRSPCDLTVYVDNQACKAFCLRQGVTKASKHFEGRLLWLQDIVQRKVLQMKYVSTHANLGDIHTKPLGPARMQCLLFLHDFVDNCDRSVGENEWNQAHALAMMKARVRSVKQVTGNNSSWCKKIALLLMMMPMEAEAVSSVAFCHHHVVCLAMVCMIFMVIVTSAAAMESSQFSSSGEDTDGWLFVPKPVSYLQYVGAAIAGAMAFLFTWSLGSRRGYADGVEGIPNSTTTTTSGGTALNGGAVDGTTLVMAILAMIVLYLFKVIYDLKGESLRLREELAGAQQPEASDVDNDNNTNDNFDEREILKDQVITLRDKVAHLTQCLVESEEKAQEFKYEIKIHLGAKRDLAKENRVLRQQLDSADRELTRARERARPPERVVVTGKGRCFHHEGCHHIYRNYNQTHVYNVCSHCRGMFNG